MIEDLDRAHKLSRNNRTAISLSDHCGCFCCMRSFRASEVREADYLSLDKSTAHCPYCGVDSVLADASGLPVTNAGFLTRMERRWFCVAQE